MKKHLPHSPRPVPNRGRVWLFRLIAILGVPAICLGVLETALRLSRYGYPTSFFLLRHISDREAWVENDRFGFRFFPRRLVRRPPPAVMPAQKPQKTYRIFVFGESAAMGDPDPSFSFGRMLQVLLRERFPGTEFEIVNTAFTAINSHAVLPIARESAKHQGDLWIVYMGNNEVTGPFGPATVFGGGARSLNLVRANLALKNFKTGQLIEEFSSRFEPRQASNVWFGLQMFVNNQIPKDDPRLERVYRNFANNLNGILRAAAMGGAKVLIGTVGSNLKDFPPFASAHAKVLNAAQTVSWEESYRAGIQSEAGGAFRTAIGHYLSAAGLDPGFADLQFRLGRCYLAETNLVEARKCLEAARDLDTLRFRTDSRLNQLIAETTTKQPSDSFRLVDIATALAQRDSSGIPGDEFFFDHVHLTFAGNFAVASLFAEHVAKLLPSQITRSDTGHWISLEACARQLAFAGWNQYQLSLSMQQRLLEAPFTNQWIHAARQQRYRDKLEALKPEIEPNALADAEAIYREAANRAQNDFFLHENFGKLLLARGDLAGALNQFQMTAGLLPHSAPARYNVGYVLSLQNKHEEALAQFRQALALRPDYAEAYNGIGQALAKSGKTTEAFAAFQRALALKPDFSDALVNLGQLWQKQGELRKARDCFTQAIAAQPNSFSLYMRLGNLSTQEGELLEATKYFSEAIRLQPESTVPQFFNSVRLNPTNAIAHYHLANALAAQNQQAEAVKSLQKAIELQPDFWEARYLLGVEMTTLNNLAEAEFQFSEVVRLKPDFSRGHLNLGVALAKAQKWNEALREFRQTLQLDPNNKQAIQYLNTLRAMAKPHQ